MKKVMILCNAGMSSSIMAKKASEYLSKEGRDIHVEASTTANANDIFGFDCEFGLFILSFLRFIWKPAILSPKYLLASCSF